ncbi:MAG: MATE family efflux transporter, partial [Bacteroidales bacterium]
MSTTPLVLGSEKIGKLLRQYAFPSIVAMTAASLYNMIDSIFIGHGVGALAISGLALTFPLMNLSAAFGSLVGAGAATLVSVSLGQKNYERATNVVGNVVSLNIIIGSAFTLLSLIFLDPILLFFGASQATLPFARDYMRIILWGNIITHIFLGLTAVLRSCGYPKKSMIITVATVILNGILDAFFIFVLGMGIKGAALATILAQAICLIPVFHHFMNKKSFIHFKKGCFRLRAKIVKNSLFIGLSPFLMNLCACFVVIFINQGLNRYGGDLSIGAYGIINRIGFIFIMIVMGLNQGIQPIAGYNYGAHQIDRVKEVLKKGIGWGIVIMTIGFLLAELFPRSLVTIFTVDAELIRRSEEGLRIVCMAFPIIGFQMVVTNFFQSIGMPKISIFLSLTRQLIFLIPGLIILPLFFDGLGIWI